MAGNTGSNPESDCEVPQRLLTMRPPPTPPLKDSDNTEGRRQRLLLGSLGWAHRAAVQHRVGMGQYEGVAKEHSVVQLPPARGRAHRLAVKGQPKGVWEVALQHQRLGKSMALPQMIAHRTHPFVSRK